MRKAIWGAGFVGKRFFFTLNRDEVAFFIDKDSSKQGEYYGIKIISPAEVPDWNELFVYVTPDFYEEIKGFLERKGLTEEINFKKYTHDIYITKTQSEMNLSKAIDNLKGIASKWKQRLLFIGNASLFEQLKKWKLRRIYNEDFGMILESYWYDVELLEGKLQDTVIFSPMLFETQTMIIDGWVESSKKVVINQNTVLRDSVEQLKDIFPDASRESCYCAVWQKYLYARAIIEILDPKLIVLEGSFQSHHVILRNLCCTRKIPVCFTHPGILPGTFPFDIDGEMGASLPAIYYKEFQQLPINNGELVEASKVWKYMYENSLNRRPQPTIILKQKLSEKINSNWPIVFYAGVNDSASHMVPYTDESKIFHSPFFSSSTEAATFLALLCAQNHWNLLYKPHPYYIKLEQIKQLPSNTIFIERGNINELIDISDVTVTILSATSYNALIRYKPVVMLGYTQLRGKGCTYEAFEENKIEHAIKDALDNGFTQEQQEAFLLHMAQCLKYYLYDDLQERPIRYGRPVPKSIDEFYELERLLHAEDVRKEKT